jgi:hypothetical protein
MTVTPNRGPWWRLTAVAARLVVPVSLVFLCVTLARNAAALPAVDLRISTPAPVATACLLQVICCGALGWTVLLRGSGIQLGRLAATRVIGRTQIAKYTRGNVLHYVGRATLARRYGVPVELAVATMTVETLILAGIGVLAGLDGLLFDHDAAGDVVSTLTANALVPGAAIAAVGVLLSGAWLGSRRVRRLVARGIGVPTRGRALRPFVPTPPPHITTTPNCSGAPPRPRTGTPGSPRSGPTSRRVPASGPPNRSSQSPAPAGGPRSSPSRPNPRARSAR